MNSPTRTSRAMVKATRPGRPPWATPAPDSMKVCAALVPSGATMIDKKASTVMDLLQVTRIAILVFQIRVLWQAHEAGQGIEEVGEKRD